jgi:hypothetical protein
LVHPCPTICRAAFQQAYKEFDSIIQHILTLPVYFDK